MEKVFEELVLKMFGYDEEKIKRVNKNDRGKNNDSYKRKEDE